MAWLCEEMARDDSAVDQVDMAGNSALHLAAKQGKLSTISVLLHHGAQIDAKVKTLKCNKINVFKINVFFLPFFAE